MNRPQDTKTKAAENNEKIDSSGKEFYDKYIRGSEGSSTYPPVTHTVLFGDCKSEIKCKEELPATEMEKAQSQAADAEKQKEASASK